MQIIQSNHKETSHFLASLFLLLFLLVWRILVRDLIGRTGLSGSCYIRAAVLRSQQPHLILCQLLVPKTLPYP